MKKNYFILLLAVILSMHQGQSQTIVERHGQLRVEGNRIKDECGRNTQLKGMSYFWHQWEGSEYWNANAIQWLRDDWKVEILRAAMGVRGSGGDYISDPVGSVNKVRAVVDGAIQHGLYVIIDFHAHPNYKAEAKTFFRQMAQEYGNYPNVIYEIWNEPIGEFNNPGATWNEIKQYAREVIAEIRAHDPNNIIVVGTPFYSQRVDVAADNRLTTDINDNPVNNIAYTIHAYAGAHSQALRDHGTYALNQGIALFMTECGRVGTNYGPNNNIDAAEWNRWEQWMDDNAISYCKWSLSNKNEISSSLQPSANANGNWDYWNDLTDEGRWNRDHFRAVNTPPSVCTGDADDISVSSAPSSATAGGSANVRLNYTASTNRDVIVVFQQDTEPYTVYGQTKVDVSAGSGTLDINVRIGAATPIANDAYQFQSFITTDGGGWEQRLDNEARTDVDALGGGSSSLTIRARGNCGSETMVLEIDGVDTMTWNNISTTASDYTYSGYNGGSIKVKFTNDGNNGCDKNLFIDYIRIGATTYQTENTASRTGCGDSQWLYCNGNFNFGNLAVGSSGNIVVRARGNCGSEQMQLRINGTTVLSQTVSTSYSNYSYSGYNGGSISVHFTNDGNNGGCDLNLYVDYIEVCGSRIESESAGVVQNVTWTNGDKQILFTNGDNNYGNPGCSSVAVRPALFEEEKALQIKTSIYPNPIRDGYVYLNGFAKHEFIIYDMTGRIIIKRSGLLENERIDLNELNNGLYQIMLFKNNQKIDTRTLIVRK